MSTKRRLTRAEAMDEETRALADNPRFQQLMTEGRHSGPGLSLEESNRRAGITDEEWAAADAEIDRLLAEQAQDEEVERSGAHRVNGAREHKGRPSVGQAPRRDLDSNVAT